MVYSPSTPTLLTVPLAPPPPLLLTSCSFYSRRRFRRLTEPRLLPLPEALQGAAAADWGEHARWVVAGSQGQPPVSSHQQLAQLHSSPRRPGYVQVRLSRRWAPNAPRSYSCVTGVVARLLLEPKRAGWIACVEMLNAWVRRAGRMSGSRRWIRSAWWRTRSAACRSACAARSCPTSPSSAKLPNTSSRQALVVQP